MKYFAFEGGIRTGGTAGGGEIEISADDYTAGLAGILSGKIITINGGFAVNDPPPEPEPEPYVPPERVPVPACVAMAALTVADGLVNGVETAVGFSMAVALDVGVYWLFFTEPQPDANYTWNVGSSEGSINVRSRGVEYMELSATDAGSPIDPAEMSIQIFRAS